MLTTDPETDVDKATVPAAIAVRVFVATAAAVSLAFIMTSIPVNPAGAGSTTLPPRTLYHT